MFVVFLDACVAKFELNATNGIFSDVANDDRVAKINCATRNLQNTSVNSMEDVSFRLSSVCCMFARLCIVDQL